MEYMNLILLSIAIAIAIAILLILFFPTNHIFSLNKPTIKTLPPGPPKVPIIGNLLWLHHPLSHLHSILPSLHSLHGSILTLHIGPNPTVFVSDPSLAHQSLILNGAVFASRPPAPEINRILSNDRHNISAAPYGPTWRTLRRNLTSGVLHPSTVRSFSHARRRALHGLLDRLGPMAESGEPVLVLGHLKDAMAGLLVVMCFGDTVGANEVEEIRRVEKELVMNLYKFGVFNFCPRLTKLLFRKLWREFLKLRKDQVDVLLTAIAARKKKKEKNEHILCYADTLLELQLPSENNRNLTEVEIVGLCSEFLNAGTVTTSTAWQWIMANLVKYPHIKDKLFMEIKRVVGDTQEDVKEEELEKMSYLKAVVLEGLRRHPPGKFLLQHAVTEDVVLGNYLVPKKGSVNYSAAAMAVDPEVWEDPMEFKPERFVNTEGEAFDITGSREIKMMPFGVGRRMCPGYGVAMLHLEYFVANLVWRFQWKAVEGDDVDLTEKPEITTVMKNPLQALISPRLK